MSRVLTDRFFFLSGRREDWRWSSVHDDTGTLRAPSGSKVLFRWTESPCLPTSEAEYEGKLQSLWTAETLRYPLSARVRATLLYFVTRGLIRPNQAGRPILLATLT
jgi:hypothetical protein